MNTLEKLSTGNVQFSTLALKGNEIAEHAMVAYWEECRTREMTEFHRSKVLMCLERLAEVCGYRLTPIEEDDAQ